MTGTVSTCVCPSCDALAIRCAPGVFDCPCCEVVVIDADALQQD